MTSAARTVFFTIAAAALVFAGCATEGRESPLLRRTSGLNPDAEFASTFCSTRAERAEDWTCAPGQDVRFMFFQSATSGLAEKFRWARGVPGLLRAQLEIDDGRHLVASFPNKDIDNYVVTDGTYVWGYLPIAAFCGISDGEIFEPWALHVEFLPDFAGGRLALFSLGAARLFISPVSNMLELDPTVAKVTWRGKRSECTPPTFSRPVCSGSDCTPGQVADTIYFGTEVEDFQNRLLDLKQRIDNANAANPENPLATPWQANVFISDANLLLHTASATFPNERITLDNGPPRRVYAWVPTADLVWYVNDSSGGLTEVRKPRGGTLLTILLVGYDPTNGEREQFEFVSDRPETSYRWH